MIGPTTVVASAARTTTGNSGAIATGLGRGVGGTLALAVSVTAASGTTPTLDLSVEWSPDGTTFHAVEPTADTFAQITAAKNTTKTFTVKAGFYRVVWTIGGTTPSFTFSVVEHVIEN